jgi:hypothetical protein
VENAFNESFNRRLRDECLNKYWFLSLADARRTIESRRELYNDCIVACDRSPTRFRRQLLVPLVPTTLAYGNRLHDPLRRLVDRGRTARPSADSFVATAQRKRGGFRSGSRCGSSPSISAAAGYKPLREVWDLLRGGFC